MKTRRRTAVLKGHESYVYCVDYSQNGKWIASAGRDQTVRLWDIKSRTSIRVIKGFKKSANSVVFLPGDKVLAAGDDDSIHFCHVITGKRLHRVLAHRGGVQTLAVSPDGKLLASGGFDRTLKLWDVASRRLKSVFRGSQSGIASISFSSDGKTIASGTLGADFIRIWETSTGKVAKHFCSNSGLLKSVEFSPSGKYVAVGDNLRVRLLDPKTGKSMASFKGHTLLVSTVSVSPDGMTLASGCWSGTVRLWHLQR